MRVSVRVYAGARSLMAPRLVFSSHHHPRQRRRQRQTKGPLIYTAGINHKNSNKSSDTHCEWQISDKQTSNRSYFSRSYFAAGPIKVADIHCDKSITERTAFPVLRPLVEYINSVHFHIIQSSWNSKYLHIFHREKIAIMHFLRLLLFFFVLLAPLQLTTADQCSRGGSSQCRSCCKKCLKNFADVRGVRYGQTVCRQYCLGSYRCWTWSLQSTNYQGILAIGQDIWIGQQIVCVACDTKLEHLWKKTYLIVV